MERSIYIPDPCHVSWKKMTPEEEGRHCAVCDKVVVDFSKKNTVQINDFLENATGKVCGRFSVDQLDHDAQMKVFKKPSNFFNKNWKFAFMAFLGFFAATRKAEAQKIRGKIMRPVGDVGYTEKPANPQTKTEKVVSGHISAEDAAHVQGAEVSIVQNDITVATATTLANGRFVIKLQAGALHGTKVTVKISHPNYATKERPDVDLTKDKTELSASLDERYMLKGEIAAPKPQYHLQGGVSYTQHLKNYPEPEVINADSILKTCTLQADTTKPETPELVMGQVMVMPVTNENVTVEILTKEEEQEYKAVVEIPEALEELQMNLYPNPASTYAVLETTLESGFNFSVFTTGGAQVIQGRSNSATHRLDVGGWTPGTYICIVREGDRARNMKLVISR